MKKKKLFILPIIALSGLFLASCDNITTSLNGSSTYVDITFDGNGGTVDGASSKTLKFRKGLIWKYVKDSAPKSSVLSRTGYNFLDKWTLDKSGEQVPDPETHKFTTNTTMYAKWNAKDITVKLNPGEGTWSDTGSGGKDPKEVTVKYDSTFAGIKSYKPTAPFGKEFTYYTTESGGTKKIVGDDYVFQNADAEKPEVLTANYIDSANYVSVTFDCNGGYIDGTESTIKSFSVIKNSTWGELTSKIPTVKRKGYTQDNTNKWTKTKNGTDSPIDTDKISVDLCVFAKWNPNDINVKLNPNGGKIDGSTSTKTVGVKYDTKFGAIKAANIPTREGYTFTYFTNSKSEVVGDDYVFQNADEVEELTANYIKIAEYVSVTFDCNGGHVKDDTSTTTKTVTVAKGSKWSTIKSSLPTVERTGYTQNTTGWTKTKDGTDAPVDTDTFDTNTTIYAKWDAQEITVKLDPNGGTWSDSSSTVKEIKVNYDTKFSDYTKEKIPTPPTGKKFVYYTVGTDTKIGDDYVFQNDGEVLTANYMDEGGGSESITVTFDATTGGSIYGSQSRSYTIPTGVKWSALKDNIIATPTDEAKEFKYYTYDVSGTATELKDDTEFTKDMSGKTFTATYDYIKAVDFATDSWATVIHNASSLENLKTVYNVTDTFVGKTRIVKIDDVDYTVQVIGEEHDVLATDKSTKTVLTFQFENLIDDGISYAYSSSDKSDYATSKLKSYLNTNVYNKLPSSLKSGIKEVNKKAYNVTDAKVNDYSDKLFTLSMSEMGYTKLPDTTTDIKPEGSAYKTYESTTLSTKYIKNYNGKPSSYLLRSPAFNGETGAVWGIDSDGLLGFEMSGFSSRQPESVNIGMGVLPAFAI